jgi:hypothetical protein
VGGLFFFVPSLRSNPAGGDFGNVSEKKLIFFSGTGCEARIPPSRAYPSVKKTRRRAILPQRFPHIGHIDSCCQSQSFLLSEICDKNFKRERRIAATKNARMDTFVSHAGIKNTKTELTVPFFA